MRAIALALALAACETASPDPGLDSMLQVANAQWSHRLAQNGMCTYTPEPKATSKPLANRWSGGVVA